MPKSSKLYLCQNCGREYAGWQGKCDGCEEWNTIVEQQISEKVTQVISNRLGRGGKSEDLQMKTYTQISRQKSQKLPTSISEMDRVLGGGLTQGGVILLTGEPGIGKSTLLTQLGISLAVGKNSPKASNVVYISAEENIGQVADRVERIARQELKGKDSKNIDNLKLVNAYVLEDIIKLIMRQSDIEIIILDSIQTIISTQITGVPGGLAQVKYCAAELASIAKQMGKVLIMVGHINKDGDIAGPKVLEHLVDVVLHFSGEPKMGLRMLRAQKNRFGTVDEVGLFVMEEQGLVPVENPGEYFLGQGSGGDGEGDRQNVKKVGVCRSLILEGNRPIVVEIQALAISTSYAYPKRVSEGVSLARLQLITAVISKYMGLRLHEYDIYVNVAQGFRVVDRAADLAIAAAIISSVKSSPMPPNSLAFGEIDLSGGVSRDAHTKRRMKEASTLGYKNVYTPENTPHLSRLKF
jgi:DNA repair protein RadA/Sms